MKDGVHMFLFCSEFPIYEHFRIIPRELTTATLAVAVTTALSLAHPIGTVLSTVIVVMISVDLVGIIQAAGFNINTCTVILLIMPIGLVVAYCLRSKRTAT